MGIGRVGIIAQVQRIFCLWRGVVLDLSALDVLCALGKAPLKPDAEYLGDCIEVGDCGGCAGFSIQVSQYRLTIN